MDNLQNWLFPTTQVGQIIKVRPLSLALFYRLGLDPWREPSQAVDAFFRNNDAESKPFLKELAGLPVPSRYSPWENLPCYYLIDYLTNEHRIILHVDLPAIVSKLDMGMDVARDGEAAVRLLSRAIAKFTDGLQAHLREEEDLIFPTILRNDFILSHDRQKKAGSQVSQRLNAEARLLGQEERLKSDLDFLVALAYPTWCAEKDAGVENSLCQMVMHLEEKLRVHSRLELDVLLLMAARIERELHLQEAAPP